MFLVDVDVEWKVTVGDGFRDSFGHHWYEAHGIGKKEIKRKRYLD
jgi:hypothetical protein